MREKHEEKYGEKHEEKTWGKNMREKHARKY